MDKIIVDMDKLTDRQKEVFLLSEKGMKLKEIAEILGCTYQNVGRILKTIRKNAENRYQQQGRRESARCVYNYNYKDADLSVLTERERKIVQKKIEGKTYIQIAKDLGIAGTTVNNHLSHARAKLENRETEREKYRKKHREKVNEYHRNYRKANPEKSSEYDKRYYAKKQRKNT